MRCTTVIAAAAALAGVATAAHGDSYEGTIMGPVAFLWPDDRVWDAADDNIGPCGSSEGPANRTTFPLDAGHVALSIADEAYKIAFYIAFDNNPTAQSAFDEQVVNNVTEVAPGHQCYLIDDIPATVGPGDNATIQLQYWAVYDDENDNKNQTFYACADITFVEAEDFDTSVPCFNVTSATFDSDDDTTTTTAAASTATGTSSGSSSSSGSSGSSSSKSSGLSTGAKAGIAVGSVIGGIAIGVAAVFIYLRRRRTGYLNRRRQSKINAPIPLKNSASFTSA